LYSLFPTAIKKTSNLIKTRFQRCSSALLFTLEQAFEVYLYLETGPRGDFSSCGLFYAEFALVKGGDGYKTLLLQQ
jgi:hypothetical protein